VSASAPEQRWRPIRRAVTVGLGATIALALGLPGHVFGVASTATVTVALQGGACPDNYCGANHNQVLL
jgi:hypothetical protein